jgi:hypothetical protein
MADTSLATKYSSSPSPTSSGLPLRAATILCESDAGDDRDAVRAFDLESASNDGVLEVPVEQLLDEVRHHFGVGLGRELVATLLERLSEGRRVLDDAVMHHRDLPLAAHVRVRIASCRRAVRRPARSVRCPSVADERLRRQDVLEREIFPATFRVSTPLPFMMATPAES